LKNPCQVGATITSIECRNIISKGLLRQVSFEDLKRNRGRVFSFCPQQEDHMDDLKKTGYQDRSKINMHEPHEVQCWTKHLGVSKEQLQKAVDKVGNGAAAVKKQLAA
jgi:hypothetical protein